MKKLLLFFFALTTLTSFATHNMAGDISYSYTGSVSFPYRYKITVHTYTKWVGTTSTDRCEIMIHCGTGDSSMAPRVNGPSINCPATTDGVLIGGCTGNVRYNVYEVEHDFPGVGNYIISIEDPNRNAGICNIPTPSDDWSFYLQSELIISPFLGNNNSPVYTEVPVICPMTSTPYYYNPLATDVDGDSLYYQLVSAMSFGAAIPGYTFPASSSSFTIDSSTGIVTWDSPTIICTYIFDIRISEYRNLAGTYYLIGKTMQEVHAITTPYVSISENNNSIATLTIFPNPSNGLINYTLESQLQNQNYQMEISNSLGQIIKTVDITGNSGIINESELSAGIYFYSLKNNTQILNKGKFVILQGSMK